MLGPGRPGQQQHRNRKWSLRRLLPGVVDNVALAPPGAAHILENSQPKPFRKNLIVAIFLPKYTDKCARQGRMLFESARRAPYQLIT